MQTYSHLILTAVLGQRIRHRTGHDPGLPFVVGSVLPDVPLGVLSLAYGVDRRWVRPHLPDKTRCGPTYNRLYFTNRWWIALTSLFHAPFLLLVYALLGYGAMQRGKGWGRSLLWLAAGCGLHTALDMVTHVDDGPVLGFPFDWQRRWAGPVSYWDEKHRGREFRLFEHLLDIGLIILWGKGSTSFPRLPLEKGVYTDRKITDES